MSSSFIRFVDFLLAAMGLLFLFPVLILLFVIGLFDTGAPIFKQNRVGRDESIFTLYKFRTMSLNTEDVATHLVNSNNVTSFGRFLRKSKLDELPQLWNVLIGDMSLVGPRPCLPSQKDLISARSALLVYKIRPGITGLAQISGIDMSTPDLLAETDAQMIRTFTLKSYFTYLYKTALGDGAGDRIKH